MELIEPAICCYDLEVRGTPSKIDRCYIQYRNTALYVCTKDNQLFLETLQNKDSSCKFERY